MSFLCNKSHSIKKWLLSSTSYLFPHFQTSWAIPLFCWNQSWPMIFPLFNLQGMTAYLEAAHTHSHSRILYLEHNRTLAWTSCKSLAYFYSTPVPFARIIPKVRVPLLQETVRHSSANLSHKLTTLDKGFSKVQHICNPNDIFHFHEPV